jgi:signal transduction histidine kinase
VWLRDETELRASAAYPSPPRESVVALRGEDLPPLPDADRVAPIHHHGRLLGALAVSLRRGAEPSAKDDELLADLGAHAALVLASQEARKEVESSRRRLVTAQTEERRRIERDLHDGAQQQLIALKVALGVTAAAAERRGDTELAAVLADLGLQVDDTVAGLRSLIAGVYPHALVAEGIGAGLRAATRGGRLPVRIADRLAHRYPADVEAATFFSCLEAVQNAVKHSGAAQVDADLVDGEDGVMFEVRDNGRGFPADGLAIGGHGLSNITDRVAALGGTVTVRSIAGQGTTVRGSIPATACPDR